MATRETSAGGRDSSLSVWLVGVAVVLLLGIPSELIVKPLGAAGTPAQIVGVGLLALWLGARAMRARGRQAPSGGPVGWLVFAFATAMLLAYTAGASRPLRDAAEASSSDRALISLAAWCGLAVAVAAGLTTMARLTAGLRILAGGVVVVAVLGILQFAVGLDVARLVSLPGLTANHPVAALIERSNFRRVTGTADHPIEFGVVLSSVLPLVVHFARFSPDIRARRRWWCGAAVIAVALPMAVARSGVLGAVVVAAVVLPTLPARLRARVIGAVGVGAIAMSFVVPGLLGTLRGLIFNVSDDPSTQGRTDDYAPVWHYVTQSPWLGRGPGTFIPSLYRTLDNQYLGTVLETGVVGLLALVVLFVGCAGTAFGVRRRSRDPRLRDLCVSLAAGIIAFGVNTTTFDLFGFAMAVGVLFLLVGAVGAITVIGRSERAPAGGGARAVTVALARGSHRRGTALLATCLLALPVVVAVGVVASARPAYLTIVSFVVEPPLPGGGGDVRAAGSADGAASVLHDALAGPLLQAELEGAGVHDSSIAIGEASIMWGTDVRGFGPSLGVAVQASNGAAAAAGARTVLTVATDELQLLQTNAGVSPAVRLRLDDVVLRTPWQLHPRRSRALAGVLALTVLMTVAAAGVRRRTTEPSRRRPGAGTATATGTAAPPPATRTLVGADG